MLLSVSVDLLDRMVRPEPGPLWSNLSLPSSSLPALSSYSMVNWSGFPSFFGIAIFAYSAHAEGLTISQDLPEETRRVYPSILLRTFLFITVLYVLFGGACYYLFGAGTPDIIFEAMAAGTLLTTVVKLAVSAVLLAQFPIAMMPALQIMEPPLVKALGRGGDEGGGGAGGGGELSKRALVGTGVFRAVTVALLAYVALCLPFFYDLMSIVGSFSTGLLGFVLPPLMYLKFADKELSPTVRMANMAICAIGVIGGLYCSYDTAVGMLANMA